MNKIIVTTPEELEEIIRKVLADYLGSTEIKKVYRPVDVIPEVMNIEQASAFLSIAKATIYQYTASSSIPHYKRGKRIYFKKDELVQWLTENKRKTIDEQVEEYERNRKSSRR